MSGSCSPCGLDATAHEERAKRTSDAINDKLWDRETEHCYSFDLRSQKHLRHDTAFSYMPLYAGVCDPQRRQQLLEHLRSRCFCIGERICAAIPSYDMCHADYEGEMYWRGPIWFNINWYLAQGLRANGADEQADWVERSLLHLATEQGFYEYYEPYSGKGLGAGRFSWTAALFLDLAAARGTADKKSGR